MSKYFDLLQEGEHKEPVQTRQRGLPQLPAGDELLELDLPFLPDTRALATMPPRPQLPPVPKRVFSFRSLVEGCFRYPGRFAAVFSVVALLTVLAVFFVPRRYLATMQLVALGPSQYAVAAGNSEPVIGPATASDVNSQASLLGSRDLLSQALDNSGAGAVPSAEREKAIDDLTRRVRVTPLPGSNTLQVSVMDSSPAKATEMLQSIASSFVSRELALLRPSHDRLVQVADEAHLQLAQAEHDLAQFKQDTGIASSADYEAAVVRQLDGYAADSANLAAKLAEVRQHRATPRQEGLKAKLALLESRRNNLLDSYKVDDPVVLNVDRQITALRDRLVRGDADPSTLEGQTQLAEHNSIDAQKRGYLAQLNQLQAQSAQFERLQKQVTTAQQTFDLAAANRDQAGAADTRDQERMLGAVLAARPSASSSPARPRPRLYVAIGLPLALLLAVMVCVYAEMTRTTVCSPAELDALTGVATLGIVPMQLADGSREMRSRKSSKSGKHHG